MNAPSSMRAPTLVAGLLLLLLFPGTSGRLSAQEVPDHSDFSRLLEGVVRMPLVDYPQLLDRRDQLDGYLASLARTSPQALADSDRRTQLAFWINAYNACMLRRVADHYPLTEARTGILGGLINRVASRPENSVWRIRNVFTERFCPVAGQRRSLDEIEHEIIRPTFQDPRIHFAVNCAARSCPPLIPGAYTPDALDEQLDQAVHRLIHSPQHFRLEAGSPPTLRLNKVLEWYAEDFGGVEGLAPFLASYVDPDLRPILEDPTLEIRFFDYDWTLNDLSH